MLDIKSCHDAAERNAIVQFIMGCPLTMAGLAAENAARMLGVPYRFWCTDATKKDVLIRFPGLGNNDLEVVPTVDGGLDFSNVMRHGAMVSFVPGDDDAMCGVVTHPRIFQVNTKFLDSENDGVTAEAMHEFGAWIFKVAPKILCVTGRVGTCSQELVSAMTQFIWQSMLWIHVDWEKAFRVDNATKMRKPYRCTFQPLVVDGEIHYPSWDPTCETDEFNRDMVRKERELIAEALKADAPIGSSGRKKENLSLSSAERESELEKYLAAESTLFSSMIEKAHDPASAEAAAEVLLNNGAEISQVIRLMTRGVSGKCFGRPDEIKKRLRRECGNAVLRIIDTHLRKTDPESRYMALRERAYLLMFGPRPADPPKGESIVTLPSNPDVESLRSVCWVCKKRASDPKCPRILPMYKNAKYDASGDLYSWIRTDVAVPRCAQCASKECDEEASLVKDRMNFTKEFSRIHDSIAFNLFKTKKSVARSDELSRKLEECGKSMESLKHLDYPEIVSLQDRGWTSCFPSGLAPYISALNFKEELKGCWPKGFLNQRWWE